MPRHGVRETLLGDDNQSPVAERAARRPPPTARYFTESIQKHQRVDQHKYICKGHQEITPFKHNLPVVAQVVLLRAARSE